METPPRAAALSHKSRIEIQTECFRVCRVAMGVAKKPENKSKMPEDIAVMPSEIVDSLISYYETAKIHTEYHLSSLPMSVEPLILENDLTKFKGNIQVIDQDCIVAGLKLDNPVILNMANAVYPGGGYRHGAAAQEENIHRRSNLYQFLEDPEQIDKERNWRYPIKPASVLYSNNVAVFRGPEDEGYPFLSSVRRVAIISCAAIARPDVVQMNGTLRLTAKAESLTISSIHNILRVCHEKGHRNIVLSALGCGAFHNPPNHISELFRHVLIKYFSDTFDNVVFAIFNDLNSFCFCHNPRGNVVPFMETFSCESTVTKPEPTEQPKEQPKAESEDVSIDAIPSIADALLAAGKTYAKTDA